MQNNQIFIPTPKYHLVADSCTFNDIVNAPSLVAGLNSKVTGKNNIVLGMQSSSTNENSIAIGSFVSSTHKNCIVIGGNVSSQQDDSVVIKQKHVSINDIEFYNESTKSNCGGCGQTVTKGVSWVHSGYILNGTEYNDIKVDLCFDCIYDCVLNFKSSQYWGLHNLQTKNSNEIPNVTSQNDSSFNNGTSLSMSYIDEMRADIEELKKKVQSLSLQV